MALKFNCDTCCHDTKFTPDPCQPARRQNLNHCTTHWKNLEFLDFRNCIGQLERSPAISLERRGNRNSTSQFFISAIQCQRAPGLGFPVFSASLYCLKLGSKTLYPLLSTDKSVTFWKQHDKSVPFCNHIDKSATVWYSVIQTHSHCQTQNQFVTDHEYP